MLFRSYKDRNLGNTPLPSGILAEECGSWVDWYGNRICTRQELAAVARREALDPTADNSEHVLLYFLHRNVPLTLFAGFHPSNQSGFSPLTISSLTRLLPSTYHCTMLSSTPISPHPISASFIPNSSRCQPRLFPS